MEKLGEFIDNRRSDIELDPMAPPYDEVRPYTFEGDGVSLGGSLSSLSTHTDKDIDFYDTLDSRGNKFEALAKICEGKDQD